MNKETKAKFKKRYLNQSKGRTVIDKIGIIRRLLECDSFGEYFVMSSNGRRYDPSRKDLISLFIPDQPPFTLKDREFIIWTGFIHLFRSDVKFRLNQRMTLEIFDSEQYSWYLEAVISGESYKPDPMYKYRENKRKELLISDRLHTIKQIKNATKE